MHFVFVYGTLKKGGPNHYLLTDQENGTQRLIGTGTTEKKFPLVVASKYNIPFMLYEEGVGENVHGEIYEVDDTMLDILDKLEEHPHWYERMLINVTGLNDIPQCWCYMLKDFKPHMMERKFLSNYSEGSSYVNPKDRSQEEYSVKSDVKLN